MNFLYAFKTKLRYSAVGMKFVDAVKCSVFGDVLYKICDKINLTDPVCATDTAKSKAFFEKNAARVQKIADALADDESKECFLKIVKFRQTQNKIDRPKFSLHDQYFPKDIVTLSKDEVFVDCGAYVGDTIKKFLSVCKNSYKRIVAFEPDESLNAQIPALPRCVIINKGVWNKKDTLAFECKRDGSGKVITSARCYRTSSLAGPIISETVQVDAIDNIPECADATFIKMDIEGAEQNALAGAEKTIRRNRPKLAICIYHSDEDMLDIPERVLALNMGYKLYVRHHFGTICETVLYAV